MLLIDGDRCSPPAGDAVAADLMVNSPVVGRRLQPSQNFSDKYFLRSL
jgi:hypothetical protein